MNPMHSNLEDLDYLPSHKQQDIFSEYFSVKKGRNNFIALLGYISHLMNTGILKLPYELTIIVIAVWHLLLLYIYDRHLQQNYKQVVIIQLLY